jgi:hypothetical protein
MTPKPWMLKLNEGDHFYYSIRNAGLIRLVRLRVTKVGKTFADARNVQAGFVQRYYFDQHNLCANEKLLESTTQTDNAWFSYQGLSAVWETL